MNRICSVATIIRVLIPVSFAIFAAACTSYDAPEVGTGEDNGDTSGPGGTDPTETCVVDDSVSSSNLPCDIFETACAPCVTAHSTVRRLRVGYTGPLYQVCKGGFEPGPSSCTGQSLDIGTTADGYADVAAHDAFCDASCTITKLYDQAAHTSGPPNDLEPSPPGGAKPSPNNPVYASDLPVSIGGHPAYGMLFQAGMGYRAGCNGCAFGIGTDMAVADEPQTIYMITSQHDLQNGCCFDYGNAETTTNNDHNGTMEAIYMGMGVIWGTGSGEGPWIMADLEDGLYAGWENDQDQGISTNTPLQHDFVTGVLVGDTSDKNGGKGRFALYGGDAQSGALIELYDGVRPNKPGYVPMQKQGSLILGTGGDNSAFGAGRFYEGATVNTPLGKTTIDALQTAIVSVGYGS